jgi:hypothetical protein
MDELERVKVEINLTEFAAGRGYRVDPRESSRNCVVMRHPSTDDKIVIARDERDGHWIYFSVRDSRDHGTIIDFVQRRDRVSLSEARGVFIPWISANRLHVAPELYRAVVGRAATDRAAAARAFDRARVVSNSAYLNSRAIRPAILSSARFVGTFREDARGNVLFPHRDSAGLSGFESKNHGWTSFSTGGVRALWRSSCLPGDQRLVLVESAIDAISFHQLHGEPRAGYASTAGTLSRHQREVLRETFAGLQRGTVVDLAFDRDEAGEKLADEVRAIGGAEFTRVIAPVGKDWNESLQIRERDVSATRGPSREM